MGQLLHYRQAIGFYHCYDQGTTCFVYLLANQSLCCISCLEKGCVDGDKLELEDNSWRLLLVLDLSDRKCGRKDLARLHVFTVCV